MTVKPNDRRRAPRAPVLMSVEFEAAGSKLGLQTLDISRSGLFLGTKVPLPVGTVLELTLAEASRVKVRVARVVEADAASHRSPGMGCAILEADDTARAALTSQLALTPPRKAKNNHQDGPWPTPVPLARKTPPSPVMAEVRVVSTPTSEKAGESASDTSAHAAAPTQAAAPAQASSKDNRDDRGKNKKDKKKGKGGKRDLFGDKAE